MLAYAALACLLGADPAPKEKAPAAEKGPAVVAAAPVRFVLGPRVSSARSDERGLGYTGGGAIEVTQPQPDILLITMTGIVMSAGLPCQESFATIAFDLAQELEVLVTDPRVKAVRLIAEAQLTGRMRRNRPGAGEALTDTPAGFLVDSPAGPVVDFTFPVQALTEGRDTFINDHYGPVVPFITPGPYKLKARFGIRSSHPWKPGHRNVTEVSFGPPVGRLPEWVGFLDPQREPPRRDLGYRIMLRVEAAEPPPAPVGIPPALP